MITFTYEEDGITVTMETDATSLYDDYNNSRGVLDHFKRFLAACDYTIDSMDELSVIRESETILDRDQYNTNMDELERLREEAKADSSTESASQDGWIEWNGGQCPVDADYYVEVMLKNAETVIERAGDFYWDEKDDEDAIFRYRVVEQGRD